MVCAVCGQEGARIRRVTRSYGKGDASISDCLLGTSSLIEDDVYDAAGKLLGQIEEIVLDARTGCVRYAVLGFGGVLGIGRKRLAVPWRALTPDANYPRCVVDVTLMHLMAMPVPQDAAPRRTSFITVVRSALMSRFQRSP